MYVGMMEHSFNFNYVIRGYHIIWMGYTNRPTMNEKSETVVICTVAGERDALRGASSISSCHVEPDCHKFISGK